MPDSVILELAVNGSTPRSRNRHVPRTPGEIAEVALAGSSPPDPRHRSAGARQGTGQGFHGRDGTAPGASMNPCVLTSDPAASSLITLSPTTPARCVRFSELQGRDPLILTLARGNYCPKEHQQHLELAANYPKVAVAYTQIVTIATDDHHTLQEFRASVGAQWTFLSDPGRTVQQDLDIAEYTDPDHNPMIPHTLVLKPGLVVHSVYNGYWFWGRPSFYDLWRDLRAATSEIRPDWDLSAPGLREAWDASDYSKFHGWDRRAPESKPTSYT